MSLGDKERSYGLTSRGTVNVAEPYKPTGNEDPEVSRQITEARNHIDETIGYRTFSSGDGLKFVSKANKTPDELVKLREQSAGRDAVKKRRDQRRIKNTSNGVLWDTNTTESMNAIIPKHLDDKYGPKIHKEYIRKRDAKRHEVH